MPFRLRAALAVALPPLLFALSLSACHSSTMNKPDIKQNPAPQQRYELTLTLQDAPGPFESIAGFMQYEVQNEQDCVPADAISGHHQRLSSDPLIAFTRVNTSNVYKGTVYLDLLQDADYYGLGVCHWKMMGFTAMLKAGEVTFNPFISGDQITAQQSKTEYFPKSYFSDPAVIKDTHTGGMSMSEPVARDPGKFFSTTLTSKKDAR